MMSSRAMRRASPEMMSTKTSPRISKKISHPAAIQA
jgi:hypothetical protein